MEHKIITDLNKNTPHEIHPNIKGMQIIEGKNNFPISWLNQQGYCEYQLYLQHIKGIKTAPTSAMTNGTNIHQQLEDDFKKTASTSEFSEVIEMSKTKAILSRECFVISTEYGIRGYIDEIWITPTEIVIIDDKAGKTPYPSTINQVRAYCLAFKSMTNDKRVIKCGLRQRRTDNIFYLEEFSPKIEKEIIFTINRMHALFEGQKPFIKTKNPNKCKSCRFQSYCEK